MIYDYFVLFVGEDGRKIRTAIVTSDKEITDENDMMQRLLSENPDILKAVIINFKLLRKINDTS